MNSSVRVVLAQANLVESLLGGLAETARQQARKDGQADPLRRALEAASRLFRAAVLQCAAK